MSCAGGPLKLYQGPRKPASEVGRIQTEDSGEVSSQLFDSLLGLKHDHRVVIRYVNDREVGENWIEVPPGNVSLKLAFQDKGNVLSKGYLVLSFEVEAGHTYIVGGYSESNWAWKGSVVDSVKNKIVAQSSGQLYVPGEYK
jgi:hypothetical protein